MNQCHLEITFEESDKEMAINRLDDLPFILSNLTSSGNFWTYIWHFSYSGQEDVAEGDFVEDLVSYFPALLSLRNTSSADLKFHFYIGKPFANPFALDNNVIAFIAVLGGKIFMHHIE
jgi:hypothetical protein